MTLVADTQPETSPPESDGAEALPTPIAIRGAALRALVRDIMEQREITQADLAAEIDYSASTVNLWLKNRYGGDVEAVEAELGKWVARNADDEQLGAAAEANVFVETPSARAYFGVLRYAQSTGRLGLIYGGSGDGKTTACKEYAAQRPNVWISRAAPSNGGLFYAIRQIASDLDVMKPGRGAAEMSEAIIAKLTNSKGLLIVDEADFLSPAALEQLRYIHDVTKVGMVFVGNYEVYAQLRGGGKREVALARIYSRLGKSQMSSCGPGDVEAVAKSLGVTARDQLAALRRIAERPGHLGNVVQAIRQAQRVAKKMGQPLAAEHIELAWVSLGAARSS